MGRYGIPDSEHDRRRQEELSLPNNSHHNYICINKSLVSTNMNQRRRTRIVQWTSEIQNLRTQTVLISMLFFAMNVTGHVFSEPNMETQVQRNCIQTTSRCNTRATSSFWMPSKSKIICRYMLRVTAFKNSKLTPGRIYHSS